MVDNATDLGLRKHNDKVQSVSELNVHTSSNMQDYDYDSTTEISASNLIENTTVSENNSNINNSTIIENKLDNENNNVNCLALTVKKDYNLSIVKHVFVRTWKTTWRVTLSIFILNFLSFFF